MLGITALLPPKQKWVVGTLTFALLLPLARPAPAQNPQGAGDTMPYTWILKYTQGESVKYRQTFTLKGEQADGKTELNITGKVVARQTVKSIMDDGSVTLVVKQLSSETTLNGNAEPDNPKDRSTTTLTFSRSGRLLKATLDKKVEGLETLQSLLEMVRQTPSPLKPVKIGESWKTDVPNRLIKGKKAVVSFTSTLLGKETVLGRETLKVRIMADIPEPIEPGVPPSQDMIKLETLYNLDIKAGRVIKVDFALDNVETTIQGNGTILKVLSHVEQILPGINDKDDSTTEAEDAKEK